MRAFIVSILGRDLAFETQSGLLIMILAIFYASN